MFKRSKKPSDEGSILLSLLAVLVIGGLLIVVAATTINGQTQTRFDRNYEQALQVSEVGLSQMTSLIQSSPSQLTFEDQAGTTDEGGSYTVSAVKDGTTWTVTSEGTAANGTTRKVQSEVVVRPLFNLAAFGKTAVDFNGGNGADSFDSALGTDICLLGSSGVYADPGTPTNANTSQTDVNMCRRAPDPGAVGTNGDLFLRGGVADKIDRAEIHNAKEGIDDPLPDATGQCIGVTETCNLFTQRTKGFYYREPIEFPGMPLCQSLGGTPANFTGREHAFAAGRAYNLGDVTLTGETVFNGTVENPSVLCVSGKLTVQQQHLINFELKSGRWVPRRPGSLLIFMTAQGNAELTMGNNASISAAIFAPNAAVICGPQGNVYGSLIANSINNAGGWNFHYDTALAAQMLNAPVRIQNWREIRG